ncbi:hypothetical protein AVEN_58050-1 [Araneus ventricosus]|uniref:Uncharacterized protein n=1 Tax=Araneus ventricosus TaxID=182803 RepID=A0A4Y2QII5_ARAVE|nr:hypothetical protein AVEN_58050-1 [Araneus ventricosus]
MTVTEFDGIQHLHNAFSNTSVLSIFKWLHREILYGFRIRRRIGRIDILPICRAVHSLVGGMRAMPYNDEVLETFFQKSKNLNSPRGFTLSCINGPITDNSSPNASQVLADAAASSFGSIRC